MELAKLKVLGIETNLMQDMTYHDDGFVSCCLEHRENIYKKLEVEPPKLGLGEMLYPGVGACIEVNGEVHIFYKKSIFSGNIIRVRAHEEWHAFQELSGNTSILEKKLLDEQGIRIDFDKINDGEIEAEIAAIYALRSRGFLGKLWSHTPYNDLTTTAKRIYRQSKI